MCGITGFYGQGDEQLLNAMVSKLEHRGPDGRGSIVLPATNASASEATAQVGLGHTRLSIIDLSDASNQPLQSACANAAIVFNGEIYNYRKKRRHLQKKGYRFHSHGDAEVLLNLYIEYGTECLSHIDGMFAFAIWDFRTATLFVARDPFGVKPLYYSDTDQGFFFASEIKSLLVCQAINRELDINAIYRTVQFMYSPGPDTILSHVKKLEPGHYLTVAASGVEQPVQYWSWADYAPTLTDETAAANAVTDALRASVSAQQVSDVPIGAFLSGGLDSSLITSLAQQTGDKELTCFTVRQARDKHVNDGFAKDLPYAIKVAHTLGVDLQFVDNDNALAAQLHDLIYHLDEPQADIAALYVSRICRVAREQGVKVLLSGAGGDDVFGGYRRHYALTLERFWHFWPRRARSTMRKLASRLPNRNALCRRINIAFRHADLDDDERLLSYFYWIDTHTLNRLFSAQSHSQLSKRPNASIVQKIKDLGNIPPLEKMLHLERRYFLADHCLTYTDKMSMQHGVEVRVPFLNTQLADLIMTLPAYFKQKGRTGKWLLKKAARQFLPDSVIYRPKTGFDGPLREWMQTDLKPLLDDCLSRQSIDKRGLFNPDSVNFMRDQIRTGKADYAYPVYAILCIELWCRIHLEGGSNSLPTTANGHSTA